MSTSANIFTESAKEKATARSTPVNDLSYWDNRAASYTEYAVGTGYSGKFLKIMDPEPDWTVLDMACGGGTLAVPLACKVKSVTAVDFSANMLAVLRRRCLDCGIKNVRTVHGRWEDDWSALGIGTHDVAVASRSLLADDARGSVVKLQNAARKLVFISTMVDTGPYDRLMFEAIGRKFNLGPDYIWYYNLLYEMGIHANVAFVPEHHANSWTNREQALEAQRWMFNGLTAGEEKRLDAYLEEHLFLENGRWWLPYERLCRWAVMWWKKE